ncbi:MAG: hypothetical protein VZR73_10680 [Acutalibacteraceae bacterium]|nr:hypothetical protein [Acutalibacteraceae bacterium]
MGQTLTHGVYLPDEGERNCYNGLAANWQLLDGAVGTIAEHTSALSGKAPLVHTHTKSDITDFPAYGNAAGTICEGNDSRLSDARTPVAHTHTKSDVTDLLNSDFIPSANNSYNLGFSSYQWNNLYAKNYYYNGVAWGLDKDNTWTNNNTYQGNLYHKSGYSTLVKGTIPSSTAYYGSFRHITYDGTEMNLFRGYVGTTGDNCYRWTVEPWVSGSNGRFQMRVSSDGSVRAFEVDGTEVSPYTNNATDLGTSTKRWKTLNGTNPGALSLPNLSAFQEPDRTDWVYDGGTLNLIKLNSNDTTITSNGWLYIRLNDTVVGDYFGVRLNLATGTTPTSVYGETGLGHIDAFVPLVQGFAARFFSTKSPTYFKFYSCQGNV